MLYIFDEVDKMDDELTESEISLLSNDRYAKIQRLRSPQGKKASFAVYLLLRVALKENYGIYEVVEFDYAEKGKPTLRDYPHIHFSLSHSKCTAVCAISDAEVGVDVQYISPISDRVAKRVLTTNEYVKFKESKTPDEYFCEIWTIKEACLKQTGQGISTELRDLSAESVTERYIYRGDGYFCCVCGPVNNIKHIRRKDFEQLCNG